MDRPALDSTQHSRGYEATRTLVVVDQRTLTVFGPFRSLRAAESWGLREYGTNRGWIVLPIRKAE